MAMYIPDGNGGRKLVNFDGTSAEPAEPEIKLKAQPRAAPAALLANAQATTAIDEVYYPDQDGGRVLIDTGGGLASLPTASTSVKGGVMIGAGLSMAGEVLNVSLTSADLPPISLPALPIASRSVAGVVRIGNGLAMDGEVLNVTMQGGGSSGGGGGTIGTFIGATANQDGTGGAVPAPLAGQERDFLCGNGTWTAITTTITIGTTPSTVDGAVWFSI